MVGEGLTVRRQPLEGYVVAASVFLQEALLLVRSRKQKGNRVSRNRKAAIS
jgi:hypothetical protein